jgi:hypothetical protein
MKKSLLTSVFAIMLIAGSAAAIDDLPTRVVTRARGVVIAIHGNALTITDSEYRNGEREIVVGPTAAITVITDDQNSYTPGDLDDITPGQTVTVGLAIDAVTAGSVQVMGEFTSGIVKAIGEDKIVIGSGSGSTATQREIPLFAKTEYRMPAETDGKKSVRVAALKEIETGQTVSIRMSTADRTKAKLITVTRLAKQPNPSPSQRSERRRSPSGN